MMFSRGQCQWLITAWSSIFICSCFMRLSSACTNDKPIGWLTHHVKGSDREREVHQNRTCVLGCVVAEERDILSRGVVQRYRSWCCPSISQKRYTQMLDDEDDGEPLFEVTTQEAIPWHLDRIDQALGPLNGRYNPPVLPSIEAQQEVHVYIIDTGIDPLHTVFRNTNIQLDYYLPSLSSISDCNGHGTKMASLLGGYVVGVNNQGTNGVELSSNLVLHIVRCLDCKGSATTLDIVECLDWIERRAVRPAMISLSLGSPKSQALNSKLESLVDTRQFLIFSAAGNGNTDACNTSPSSAAGVIGVGASDEAGRRSSYSNYGQCVKVFAPGDNIFAANLANRNEIVSNSGTSFADPLVVGVTARYMLLHPEVTDPYVAWNTVLASTVNGVITNAGAGSVNKFIQVGNSGEGTPPAPVTTTSAPQNPLSFRPSTAATLKLSIVGVSFAFLIHLI